MTAHFQNSLGIDAAGYELPGQPIDVYDWAKENQGLHPSILKRVDAIVASGSRYFHIAPDIGEVDLAIRAVGKVVGAGACKAADIGAVIHVYTQPFSVPAAPRSLPLEVASAFGIRPVWAGSIAHLKCVSTAGALDVMDALMATYPQLNAGLIVSVDRIYGEKFRLRQASGIQCDGAACMLVTRKSTRNRIGSVAVRNCAPKWYRGPDAAAFVEQEIISYEFLFTHRVIREAIDQSGAPLANYGRLLPHNSDLHGWQSLCRAMGIPGEKLFADNIFQRAHACCSDFAINLVDAGFAVVDGGKPVVGVMLSNMGAFGAVTLHPLPTPSPEGAAN